MTDEGRVCSTVPSREIWTRTATSTRTRTVAEPSSI